MKYLIIIATLLAGALTELVAQENKTITLSEVNTSKEINSKEFKISTNENLEIDVKVIRQNQENLNIFILDRQNRIIAKRENLKEGTNKITFEMEDQDEYMVRITSEKPLGIDLRLVQK